MRKTIKDIAYRLCRSCGLFAIARQITGKRLRILCYHGLSLDDEHLYLPGLFMRPETLRQRCATLSRLKYPVLPLSEAVSKMQTGALPACAIAITCDDGFYGNYKHGISLCDEFTLPSTIYVTTYYVINPAPVFRLVIQYMFLKTVCSQLDLAGLPGVSDGLLDLSDSRQRDNVMWELILHAESVLNLEEKEALQRELGERLKVCFSRIKDNRLFSLMTPDEIRDLAKRGIDIQLHTHRHQFPPSKDRVIQEIHDNRAVLEPLVNGPLSHLCYPSGVFCPEQWPWLEQLGIISATTCEVGLNDARTPRHALRRFLDSETVSELEFEAEISGFSELLRGMVGRRARASVSPHSHER